MDPITTAAIATVLSTGLLEVGKTFVKNAVEPPAKEAAKPISAWLDKRHDKKRLQNAVRVAFTEIGAPQEDDALSRYARNLGFDQLQAAGNDELRQEVAERQQAAAANTDRLQTLKAELDRQQLMAGLTPVQGPGVLVTLDDSDVQIPGGDSGRPNG